MPDALTARQFDFASRHLGVTVLPGGISRQEFLGLSEARQNWDTTLQSARDRLVALEGAILTATKDKPYFAETAANTSRLFAIFDVLDPSLSETLERAIAAPNAKTRDALISQARSTTDTFTAFARSDPMLSVLDENPFMPVTIQADLQNALAAVAKALA